jgi:hypothetical protein
LVLRELRDSNAERDLFDSLEFEFGMGAQR